MGKTRGQQHNPAASQTPGNPGDGNVIQRLIQQLNAATARAEHASAQLRMDTRSANEAIQGLRDAKRELDIAVAGARKFAEGLVPGEVTKQLAGLEALVQAALDGKLAQAVAQFEDRVTDAAIAYTGATEDALRAGYIDATADIRALCPHCKRKVSSHVYAPDDRSARPHADDAIICDGCQGLCVFVKDEMKNCLYLRKPTDHDMERLSRDSSYRTAVEIIAAAKMGKKK